MARDCKDCGRTFGTKQALRQHLRDSPIHAVAFHCDECDRAFDTEQALQQHLRDSPVHATVTFNCDDCDRAFDTEQALQQHLRDSPVHAVVTFNCDECDDVFDTEQALQQHLGDPSVHAAATFDCDECDRAFNTEQALQQHRRDSPAHTGVSHSFDVRPSLHDEVLQLLRAYDPTLHFQFFPADNPHGALRKLDTSIMGRFTCTNGSCPTVRWTSKQIAITIRQYPGQRYNARVYFQRCKSCDSLSRPDLDSSYAERVSYRLAKWSGIAVEEPSYSGHSRRPHESSLCEGCRYGHCQQSRL